MAISFLEQIVKAVSSYRLDELCFVVPNRRATFYLNQTISKTLSKPSIGPQIFDIDSFVSEVSGTEVPSKMELMFSLYQSYCDVVPEDKKDAFSAFLGWGDAFKRSRCHRPKSSRKKRNFQLPQRSSRA